MRAVIILLLLAGGRPAHGQALPLEALRALLLPARGRPLEHIESRGATADLTLVKHRLRDWVESRLTPMTRADEDVELAFQLNADLKKAGLTCNDPPDAGEVECANESLIGFLGDIKLHRSGGFLVVQTAVGIQCGEDESAYAYEWKENHWQRLWESEQNDYRKDKYLPQRLQSVLISPTDYRPGGDRTEHLVVTLGVYPWCSSNWQEIYYRIWQIKTGGGQPNLLLDESEVGYISEPVQASVWADDVLIEYAVASTDGGVHNRRQIRHYVARHGTVERVDPFVLGPRDFADHWLTGPSKEVLEGSAANVITAWQNWRRRFEGSVEFIDPTRHCIQQPDLWQVGVLDPDTEKTQGYFLIRWRPPYHFSMIGVSEHPWPNCTEKDPQADEFRTLFPDRDWH